MKQEPDGTSQFGFAEAVYEALHSEKYAGDAQPGTTWKVTDSWIEVGEHSSPWHITYNVIVQQGGGG
jgi:hypothetical protein